MKMTRFHVLSALAASSLLGAGCEGCHSHGHPHGSQAEEGARAAQGEHADANGLRKGEQPGHGEGSIGITKWTDKLELFAEHPPAVAGQTLPFLAHLTILDGFKALEQATVTLVLDGPTRVEARVGEKLRPGIFQPTLVAPAAGTYRGSLLVAGPEVDDIIDGFEIVVHPDEEAGAKASARREESGTEPLGFLKERQWQIPFGTAFATRGSIVPSVEVAGEVTTPPSGQADVGASVAGRVVSPAGGLPRPGQSVRRGELMASIAPTPSAPEGGARAALAVVEAEARAQAGRAAVERAERLIADRAISPREVEEARRELRVAEETVQAARRAQDVFSGAASGHGGGSYRVSSPIDGVVVEVAATEGKSVQSGDLLFRVVNPKELWIRARVPEQQAAMIQPEQDAAFKLPSLDAWLPLDITGDDAAASVISVGRTVDRRSRTVDVIYGLRAPDDRLRVGALLRVAVPAGPPWQGVVVPRGAVLDDDGRSVVYVQVEGEAFEERAVRVGPKAGPQVGIVSGVEDGERVVTLGANVIRLSSRAGATPAHGHVH